MVNAIRYILHKRNMQQKDLITKRIIKQSISKYINKERRIPDYAYKTFEQILNIPHEFFVDNNGYCKELGEKEIYDIDYYIETNPLPNTAIVSDYESLERKALLEKGTKVCLRKIKTDIYDTRIIDIKSQATALNTCEANLSTYNNFLRLHKSNVLSPDEWRNIFKGISYLIDYATQDEINDGNNLSHYIYDAIIKYRKERIESNNELIELFYPALTLKPDDNND